MACATKQVTCDWQTFCKKRGKCLMKGHFTLKATSDCPMRDMANTYEIGKK